MIILPAVDLLGGKCVRLLKGDYDKVTVYNDDPLSQAWEFKEAGAQWIHVVDLDAARTGVPTNHAIIRQIAEKTGLKVDTGGGIRNMDTLRRWIEDYGVSRCVLGTAAVRDRAFTENALELYGDKIAIGIDAKDGEVAVDGWTEGSGLDAVEFALIMKSIGAETIVFTDIARDGMLTGPAVSSTKLMVESTGLDVIASGGIGSNEDIDKVRTTGCAGVIVGKAIYEGKVDLKACLQKG
ncbi:MAG: 1-(5-phosphoribosyl)-5-[(5-phosphoribosylamino)methylideneamino]imidazole-4-carboxamide isomerase [Clostridiales bacterium]|nr:1-(5-phosphoribosyl)-5-[(5-phosphoribosylamino)methylideneamino]imidazole-4-carboxamide isomerase [Clostridiales bacterium]MCR5275511.1 1-(5-phosphoribosyl)-5-[(5-phosphoribosylamino)methylideneamino]imidazole-4-carboxamide isomerase [Clostridiales bacterium]